MIAFTCPSCKKALNVMDELGGKRRSCPHCKKPVTVPAKPQAAPANLAEAATVAQAALEGDTPSSPEVQGMKLDFLAPKKKEGELGWLGRYRVLKVLGQGGMGMVLLAEDPLLKRSIALKVMRPELAANEAQRKRFLREAQATAAVEHDHIIAIHEVGVAGKVPFIAMPFLRGEALDKRLKRQTRLPVAEAIRIARESALGLAAAHEHGLIHRDIKPANIWLETRGEPGASATGGRVKIMDFGLARVTEKDDVALTKTGTILGTPAYMAPEQAMSKPVDFRTDLFSLGVVLYQMLTGERPFKGHDTMAVLAALITQTPKRPRALNAELPRGLDDLVMQLLAKEPKQRPASAGAVADALRALEDDKTQVLQTHEAARVVARGAGAGLLRLLRGLFALFLRLLRVPGRLGLVINGLLLLAVLAPIIYLVLRSGPSSPGPATQAQKPAEPKAGDTITNSIGMKLAYIPAGEFTMGSPDNEANHEAREGPQHRVKISKPFYLGVYEVKQGEYEKVIGVGKPNFSFKDPDNPAENITWDEATEFCKKLSDLAEEKKAGRVYRLPTEAEWEYACRAGTTTVFHYGNSLSSKQANFNGEEPYGGAEKRPRIGKTVKCGSYQPNAWGLYDMHGNVWEWCLDGPRTYPSPPTPLPQGERGEKAVEDPRGPETAGGSRVLRGGSWFNEAWRCRSAFRDPCSPSHRVYSVGFRVMLVR